MPIEEHHVRNNINSNIQYSQLYSEYSACIAAGLDIEKWISFKYSSELKSHVVAWWLLKSAIALGQQDAKNRKEEIMQKRASKKRR